MPKHPDKKAHGHGEAPPEPVCPLEHLIRVDSLTDSVEDMVSLDAPMRAEIAALQDLPALDSLTLSYRLKPLSGRALLLEGRLQAAFAQTCVVTLEPVESWLDLPVKAEFWPVADIERWKAEADEDSLAAAEADWPEPIVERRIDLGPLIYETFATNLDPYPRAEGAEFEWNEDDGDGGKPASKGPFAALEHLKKRS